MLDGKLDDALAGAAANDDRFGGLLGRTLQVGWRGGVSPIWSGMTMPFAPPAR